MLARLNFLFSVAFLALLAFGLTGRFVIFKSISAIAPGLTPYFIAAYMLAALMLSVLIVAKLVIKLGSASEAARSLSSSKSGYGAQVVLCLAHLCLFFALRTLVEPESGARLWLPWLAAPALYSAGIAVFVNDLRRRVLQSSD